ncbi:ferrochelatase [Candidatus Marinimicrobia bacterium]|nr:ferrochelatase [Candidatus Neomarinimicrobiota bacterium]
MQNNFKNKNQQIGILITNLGTPDSPTKKDLKKYLNQFLMDKRVVDLSRLFWVPLLKLIILNVRPKKSAKLYKSIWTDQGSPLLAMSKNILQSLKHIFSEDNRDITFDLGMRYGNPSIKEALQRFKDKSISKILVLPLYPQAGSPTTSSTFDAVSSYLSTQSWTPNLRFISGYHDHKDYIISLSRSIKDSFSKNGKPDKLIFSYHGMPDRYLQEGDPYYCFCHKTTRLVAEKLKLDKDHYEMAFQSRFGYEKWLQPYLDDMIPEMAKNGVNHLQIISPGFSVDCLETLEEINIQYRELFEDNGGKKFNYIPCLNDSDNQLAMIKNLVLENIKGWDS